MGVLYINYGQEKSFRKSIKDAKTELNNRVDDYKNIEHRVKDIPGNSSNTSNCGYYVKKKYQQLQDKVDKLNKLDDQVVKFIDDVEETDKKVAKRIKKDTKTFKKQTGIGKRSKSLLASICGGIGDFFSDIKDGLSKIWDNIKQFYEDHKYIINIIVDVALVALAVVACIGTGGLALAVGIFFVADAVCDLAYDGAAAYQYYVKGNEAEAERLSGKGGKDAFMWVGRQADRAFGTDFFEGALGIVYTGLSICAIGYSIFKAGEQLLKDLKLDKIKVKSLFNGNRNKIKWGSHFNKENIIKAISHQLGFKKVKQKNVVKWGYRISKVGINLKDSMKYARSILTIHNAYKGGKKTIKTIKKYYDVIFKGANPAKKTTEAIKDYYDSILALPSGGVT